MSEAIETTIVGVTVFSGQARVVRRGRVALPAGQSTLLVHKLPSSLVMDSVRASGLGAGVKLLGVDVRTEYVPDLSDEEAAAVREEIRRLQQDDQTLQDEDDLKQKRLTWLNALGDRSSTQMARALAGGTVTLEDVTALASYLEGESVFLQDRRREIALRREELKREIEALQKRLKDRRLLADANSHIDIAVDVEAEAAVEFTLDVEYAIRGASWKPLYDLRLNDDGSVALTYLATVKQRSGEDWPAMALALSTARPALSDTLPELDPWYIDVRTPPQPKARAMMAAPSPAMDEGQADGEAWFSAMPMASAAPVRAAAPAVAAVETSSGGAFTYRIERPVAIPADDTPRRTTVTVETLSAALDYYVVPGLAEEAYLRATVTNTSEVMILPGDAAIFHGADYVGRTMLKTVAPGEEFEVQLGVDNRLRVKRELTRREVSKALIGPTRRLDFAYRVTLNSLLDRPVSVTVHDRLPLSLHESIRTKLASAQPQPQEQTDMNILKWTVTLQPGKQQDITFTYQVEHPRGTPITGLDVR
ncbi:MAG: mucoidy inhibitor MuiA family protein [Anaerolineae bacterium]|nr:mucoidy inhibitor MuiA family protein [Anaerolineae bacterium]